MGPGPGDGHAALAVIHASQDALLHGLPDVRQRPAVRRRVGQPGLLDRQFLPDDLPHSVLRQLRLLLSHRPAQYAVDPPVFRGLGDRPVPALVVTPAAVQLEHISKAQPPEHPGGLAAVQQICCPGLPPHDVHHHAVPLEAHQRVPGGPQRGGVPALGLGLGGGAGLPDPQHRDAGHGVVRPLRHRPDLLHPGLAARDQQGGDRLAVQGVGVGPPAGVKGKLVPLELPALLAVVPRPLARGLVVAHQMAHRQGEGLTCLRVVGEIPCVGAVISTLSLGLVHQFHRHVLRLHSGHQDLPAALGLEVIHLHQRRRQPCCRLGRKLLRQDDGRVCQAVHKPQLDQGGGHSGVIEHIQALLRQRLRPVAPQAGGRHGMAVHCVPHHLALPLVLRCHKGHDPAAGAAVDPGIVVNGQIHIRLGPVGCRHPLGQGHVPPAGHIVHPHRPAVIPRQDGLQLVRHPAVQGPLPGLPGIDVLQTPLPRGPDVVTRINADQHGLSPPGWPGAPRPPGCQPAQLRRTPPGRGLRRRPPGPRSGRR